MGRSSPPGRQPSCNGSPRGEFSAQFALSLALKDVRPALVAAGDEGFEVLACLADEWQHVVDQGLGDQDLTVVARALGRR